MQWQNNGVKKPKTKTCKSCKKKFEPVRPLQQVCSMSCAIAYSRSIKEKADRQLTRALKIKLKTKPEWIRETQVIFNKYIRLRDKNEPCISCQRHHTGEYHAGHYRTTKAAPELRFDENNVHKQCSACNNHLSGNILEYRKNLIKKIGLDRVEWLEGKHDPKHYSIEDIKEIKELYKLKIKLLDMDNG